MANLSHSESKKKHKHDLASASSWGHFEKLLFKQAPPPPPPPPPPPSPISPKSPFSFQPLHRLDETFSRLPGADFHLYGTHPASRSKQLVLCSECGQPVPPCSLARHFDSSHTSPPPSPPVPPTLNPLNPPEGVGLDLKPRAPLSLPLQPSFKLNNQTHAQSATKLKLKNPKPPRPKDPLLSPAGPPVPPVPLKPERDSVLKLAAPSKRFPSFLADSGQHAKLLKLDAGGRSPSCKNVSFSCVYAPCLPPAVTFRHLPSFPRPLAFGPPGTRPRLTPAALLLSQRRTDGPHYSLAQLLEPS